MEFKKFVNLVLPLLVCCFFATANAQIEKNERTIEKKEKSKTAQQGDMQTTHPYTWKESTDKWYTSNAYSFRYPGDTDNSIRNPTDRGPVSAQACKDAIDPSLCTENLMKAKFLNIYQPGITFPEGYSGVEYVSFEVGADGKVNGYEIAKQGVVCEPCAQAAVNSVASLNNNWQPATRSGKPANSTVVIPVYFNTTMTGDDK